MVEALAPSATDAAAVDVVVLTATTLSVIARATNRLALCRPPPVVREETRITMYPRVVN
jgi:hypothetical protein